MEIDEMENTSEKRVKLEIGKFNRDSWAVWTYVSINQGTWSTGELLAGRYNTREQAAQAAQDIRQYLKDNGFKVG